MTGAGRTLTYTPFNKVKSIVKGTDTTAFVYGPERTRIKRTDEMRDNNGTSATTTLYLGNVEKVIAPGGSYTWKRYITDGVLIEQTHDKTGARTGELTCYLLYDHLGSVDVITDAFGTVVQDLSFDAWGQRRAPDEWTVLALMRLTDTGHGRYTTRGYTGHEMLDAVGIIHMNGRIYDPRLGRFMQADPVIQFPDYSQGWNRYSYVLKNPLNATDPTGYFIGKLFRKLVGVVINGIGELLFSKVPVLRQFSTLAHCLSGNALTCGAVAAGNAYAGGASLKRALKAGVFAYVSAEAFTAVGDYFQAAEAVGGLGHLGAHALTGGILAELQGGEFGHGFLSAGVAFGVGQLGIKQGWSVEAQFVSRVVSAGTVSEMTGGKFANGATTAAFAFVYNELEHGICNGDTCIGYDERRVIRRTGSEPRIRWQGTDEIDWLEIDVDSILEFLLKRPILSISVRTGIESGRNEYEYQVGYQKYQYVTEGLGVTNTYDIGDTIWTNETIWKTIPQDQTKFTRPRRQLCVVGVCGPE